MNLAFLTFCRRPCPSIKQVSRQVAQAEQQSAEQQTAPESISRTDLGLHQTSEHGLFTSYSECNHDGHRQQEAPECQWVLCRNALSAWQLIRDAAHEPAR
jgi:hypothetical protein